MRVKHLCRMTVPAVVAVALALAAAAETKTNKLSKVSIRNFGCINENYYRGAQPQEREYAELASLGVKTVIDLEEDGDANEKQKVESAGMQFFRFAMNTTSRPDSKIVAQFLKLVDDPANQPVFVHCHGGRHRTRKDCAKTSVSSPFCRQFSLVRFCGSDRSSEPGAARH